MAGVQEAAQTLVRAIRASSEYKAWERIAKQVSADTKAEKRLTKLRQQTLELQAAQMQGENVPTAKVKALEEAAQTLQADSLLGPYLQAEWKLMEMLAGVQETLSQTLNLEMPGTPH